MHCMTRIGGCFCLLLALLTMAGPATADVVVQDFRGHEVRLAQPARRIVALAPHLVENLYSAGAGAQLVGTVAYSDYPPEARNIPRVGGYNGVSLEAIVAQKPDLVVAWASSQGATPAMLDQLRTLGIPVYIDKPEKLDDIARAIADLGVLSGHAEQAQEVAADFRSRLSMLRQRYADREPVSMFYQVWDEPLQTLGGNQIISRVVRLCGGRNIFADAMSLAPRISIEAVLDRDPQVIVASGMSDGRPAWLDDWREWPGLQAVAHDDLYFVDPDFIQRATIRILDGASRLCRQLQAARER